MATKDITQNRERDLGRFIYSTMECRYFPKPKLVAPEIELIYISKGEGVCFAGDGMVNFRAGELYLFVGGMSHYFKSAPQFYDYSYPLRSGATYMQLSEGILPAKYHTMPCCKGMATLFESASRGLKWSRLATPPSVVAAIEQMDLQSGFRRLMTLYEVLDQLGQIIDSSELIASEHSAAMREGGDGAFRSVLDYIMLNFQDNITLEELALNASMNRTALCRHFRGRVGRSIFDFLLEYRIRYAQQQLLGTKLNISQIAQEAGFNNLPNFNVQFKRLCGCTPGEFRNRERD